MNKKDCKILAWGLSTMSLLFLKLPVYASAGDPGDSAREMIRMITIFGLAAAALIIIIIIIAQLRKGSSRRVVDERNNSISEKIERKKEQMYHQPMNDGMMNPSGYPGGSSANGFTPQNDMYGNAVDDSSQDTIVLNAAPKPSEKPQNIMLIEKNTQDKIQVPIADEIIIGRNSNMSDLVLKGDKAVSGKHCKITHEKGKFFIEDIGSSNGTYVNQTKIKGKTEIVNGDELVMGRRKYQFQYM